jgi:hypothetical protein
MRAFFAHFNFRAYSIDTTMEETSPTNATSSKSATFPENIDDLITERDAEIEILRQQLREKDSELKTAAKAKMEEYIIARTMSGASDAEINFLGVVLHILQK